MCLKIIAGMARKGNMMIVKNIDETQSRDKYVKAGLVAEKQMAFYLNRAFGDEPNVLVLNGIRITQGDDAAQIDHLLLHEFGMVIVESKSVSTEVSINEHGEWSRIFNGSASGMPSPVLQAKRQGEFLKRFLEPHTASLLKKLLGIQMKFDKMPIDIVVAISDTGIINRPKKIIDELEYVCKADRAVEKIHEIIKGYRKKENNVLSLGAYILGKTARANISAFLIKNHSPANNAVQTGAPPKALPKAKTEYASSRSFAVCKHCSGKLVDVTYGKYGYYLKCRECEKNTPIRENCSGCGKPLKVRKEKEKFFLECKECDTSVLFHKNARKD